MDTEREKQSRKNQFDKLFALVPEKDRNIVSKLIFKLFPQVEGIYQNHTVREETNEWFNKKRICSEKRFGNYFYLMLAEGEISQSEMNLISQASADQNELSKILRKLLKDGRLRRCLQRLPEFLDSIPGENVENTVLSIFNISDKISRKRGGDFDFGVEWDIYRFAYHMLKKIPSENRYVALENILKESKSVDSPIHLISIGEDEHKKGKGEDLLSIEELQKIIPIALTKIKLYAEKRKLDSSPGFAYILYRWKRWGDEKEVKSYINELFKSPQGIATFIKGFISERSESSRNKHWVSYKDMKDFIDLDILKTKINQIESKEKQLLSAEDQEYINSYLYRVDKAIEGNDSIFD